MNIFNGTKGLIHCHTEHSLKDSALSVKAFVKRAKEMGVEFLSLNDHGTCTGIITFVQLCEDEGINPIPGVEAYILNDAGERTHLALYAKNYTGYQELCRFITEGNKNIYESPGKVPMPLNTKEHIRRFLGNGNVIAASACVNGVLAGILLENDRHEKAIRKAEAKRGSYKDAERSIEANSEKIAEVNSRLLTLDAEKDRLGLLAAKKYKQREKAVKSLPEAQRDAALEKIGDEKEESRLAAENLILVKRQIAALKKTRTAIAKKIKEAESYIEKNKELTALIKKETALIRTQDELIERAKKEIGFYKEVFGDDFYIELQYHGYPDEKKTMPVLCSLAKETGVKTVAANDSHMAFAADHEQRAFMKALRFSKWEDASDWEKQLYMKTDQELYEALCLVLDKEDAKTAVRNVSEIGAKCKVVFPKTPHYPKYRDENGKEVEDSAALLRKTATSMHTIRRKFLPSEFTKEYRDRLNYELDVVINMGFADYLLIVSDFLNYAHNLSKSKEMSSYAVGYGTGPGRGSACGSLLCYLLGITKLDPIKYGLLFERFLNKERVSMPDIDSDFSEEVREKTIDYVRRKYGEDSVACIRTIISQSAKASLRNSARIRGFERYPDTKDADGRREMTSKGDRLANLVSSKPGTTFASCEEENPEIFATKDTDEQVILKRAKSVEGSITGTSIHAAGVIIGDGHPLSDYVPLLYNEKKKRWAVQCDMVESEAMGLLKMDFLGLKNLDAITETLRRIKKNTGDAPDMDSLIPDKNDEEGMKRFGEVMSEIFAKGNTSCVFQFESEGMKRMLREFQPETFEDLILLVAAYRPGPMEFIPEIINVKHGRKTPEYIVPKLRELLSPTYGYPIYQEQLMNIFHFCAGFTLGEADIIRRYMSKKKVDKFLAYKGKFVDGLVSSGADRTKAEEYWESLVNFAKYGFNKSHAAAYALVAYQTAYLKHFYPKEYMCAVLNTAKIEKIPGILHECSRMGVKVLPPDINMSGVAFEDKVLTPEEKKLYPDIFKDADSEDMVIMYGLGNIKGAGSTTVRKAFENKGTGYTSFKDFVLRGHEDTGTTQTLIRAGAFDNLHKSLRTRLEDVSDELVKYSATIKKKEKHIEELKALLDETLEPKKVKDISKRIEDAKKTLLEAQESFENISLAGSPDDLSKVLEREHEVLGGYLSADPLEPYKHVYPSDSKEPSASGDRVRYISDFEKGEGCYAGLVSNCRIAKRKKDGKDMAFFDLIDPSGTLPVKIFTDAFERCDRELIKDGCVLIVKGKGIEEDSYTDENETRAALVAAVIEECPKNSKRLLICVNDLRTYDYHQNEVRETYGQANGCKLIIMNRAEGGRLYQARFEVNETLLNAAYPWALLRKID